MGICYSAADTPNNARYRHRRYANPLRKNNRKIKLIIGASGFGFVRSTTKRQTPLVECLFFMVSQSILKSNTGVSSKMNIRSLAAYEQARRALRGVCEPIA